MREGGGLARLVGLLRTLVAESVDQLGLHWRSHALTLVGIVWGANAVVVLLSIGAGFNTFLDFSVSKTGDRWTAVFPEYTSMESDGRHPGRPIVLTVDDLDRLRGGVPSASAVSGEIQEPSVVVESARRTRSTVVAAVSPEVGAIENHRVARGRWLEAADERDGRHVAVLGANLVPIFFGDASPLGQRLTVAGMPFEVVGVLAQKGFQLLYQYDIHDNMLFLPLEAGRRVLGRGKAVDVVLFEPRDVGEWRALRAEVRAEISPVHHIAPADTDALVFRSVPEFVEPSRKVGLGLQVLLGLVGTVTLGMAAVGVANLMMAIANERRQEFAVRRACGARRLDVMLQLLVETLVVVLAGGVGGVAIGLTVVGVIGVLPLPAEFPVPHVAPSVVLTTFAVLVVIGLAAGIGPARTASRMDPAAALRAT